uniref:(northern house mosquito) hypothetical protein n=1 Tax=Culex pipiens TaxID=7175 RepID=A0A8D8FVI0_CULPI
MAITQHTQSGSNCLNRLEMLKEILVHIQQYLNDVVSVRTLLAHGAGTTGTFHRWPLRNFHCSLSHIAEKDSKVSKMLQFFFFNEIYRQKNDREKNASGRTHSLLRSIERHSK